MSGLPTALRRSILVVAAGTLAATTIAGVAPAQTSPSARNALVAPEPLIRLDNAVDKVVLEQFGRGRVNLDLGVYAIAGADGFEIHAHRWSWSKPIKAALIRPGGNVALPGAFSSFQAIGRFVTVTFAKRSTGTTVAERTFGFCPSGDQVRIDPNAAIPARPYPPFCPFNPFTRGGVYGISPHYGIPVFGEFGRSLQLPVGHYTATVSIRPRYVDAFGLSPTDATSSVKVDVVPSNGNGCIAMSSLYGCKTAPTPSTGTPKPSSAARTDPGVPAKPGARPTVQSQAPLAPVLPDLRSLPATAIQLDRGFVSFAATVWNAGPSPLVVDGFRRSDQDIMDAYQYYFDANGQEVGHDPAGTMEWDPRHGHQHWHFKDFARYRLLDADKHNVVRSRKEAFCLANTDAVDYTRPGANWNPFNTDLHTSCGSFTSKAVREVLDAGNGDTYFQGLPGQSFKITDLPNGTYYIAVEANPHGVIHETSTANNNSYRKILLRGTANHRRVVAPQVGVITDDTFF